jgi:hypothetical protein
MFYKIGSKIDLLPKYSIRKWAKLPQFALNTRFRVILIYICKE